VIFFVLIISLLFVSAGMWTFEYGRSLPTADENICRNQSLFSEFLYGPPGYERIRSQVGGVVLILIGVLGIVWAFFSLVLK